MRVIIQQGFCCTLRNLNPPPQKKNFIIFLFRSDEIDLKKKSKLNFYGRFFALKYVYRETHRRRQCLTSARREKNVQSDDLVR